MNIDNKKSFIVTVLLLLIFVSIFTYARAIVSISVVIVILMYVFYSNKFLQIFKEYPSFWFLLSMGVCFSIASVYSGYSNGITNIKDIVSFSNPLILLLFSFSIINFLYGQKKNIEVTLNFICLLTLMLSFVGLVFCAHKVIFYGEYNILVNDLYQDKSAQFFIAFIFPFVSVLLIGKAFDEKRTIFKIAFFVFAIIVILVDVLANRSMLGWLNEFIVFCYYFYKVVCVYAHKDNIFQLRRSLFLLFAGLIFFIVAFTSSYNISPTIKSKINSTTFSLQTLFFTNNEDSKKTLEHTSTGLRSLYYISSLKTIKEYPKLLLLGCPGLGYTLDVKSCTADLINKSQKLSNDNRVVAKIFPHNEFFNYTFRSGIIGGLSLFLFLISLFFHEAKKVSSKHRLHLRILVIMFSTGCIFDFFMSSQIIVVSFFIILAIILASKPSLRKI